MPFKVYTNLFLFPFRYSLSLVFPLLKPHSPHARKICCRSLGRWVLSFDDDDTDTCLCSRDEISQFALLVYATSPSLDSEFFPPPSLPEPFAYPLFCFPLISWFSHPFPFYLVLSFTVLLPLFSPSFSAPCHSSSSQPLLLALPLPLCPLNPLLLYPIPPPHPPTPAFSFLSPSPPPASLSLPPAPFSILLRSHLLLSFSFNVVDVIFEIVDAIKEAAAADEGALPYLFFTMEATYILTYLPSYSRHAVTSRLTRWCSPENFNFVICHTTQSVGDRGVDWSHSHQESSRNSHDSRWNNGVCCGSSQIL